MSVRNLFSLMPKVMLILWGSGMTWTIIQAQELNVLDSWLVHKDAPNSLYNYLASQAFEILDQKYREVDNLETESEWLAEKKRSRESLFRVIGDFPEKTPLNPQVTGIYDGDGYRMEKVVYESMPGYHVTSALYIPDGAEAAPAVIYCSGHSNEGFRSNAYQWVSINLVKKGFVVLAFDPVGQGERYQYWNSELGESNIGGPTREHSYPGTQAFLAGLSLAKYMIWDGIRSIDYLETRPEVDSSRIGITGRSGGGTQSSYIAAVDDRITAAAPECYITSYQRLLESIGPQDAEQNFYHGIAEGLDHLDLLLARAPKPTMMITTTRDFFSIQGARETFARARKAWKALGGEDAVCMVEDNAPHASTEKNREAMYAFFRKHLDLPGEIEDQEVELIDPADIRVTETGQVVTSYDETTLFELIRKESRGLPAPGVPGDLEELVAELSGYQAPAGDCHPVFAGRLQREGYLVEKYFAEGEGGYPLPFLLFIPEQKPTGNPVLYLHPQGKDAAAGPGGEIEAMVKAGHPVLAPDLVGLGEMGPGSFTGDAWDFKVGRGAYNIWYLAMQLKRSLVGIRASDVNLLTGYLTERFDTGESGITAVARGTLGPVLQHAALLNKGISRVALADAPSSWRMLLENEYYRPELIHGSVAGALRWYDLPDLVKKLSARDQILINPVDQRMLSVRKEEAVEIFGTGVKFECELTPGGAEEVLLEWLD